MKQLLAVALFIVLTVFHSSTAHAISAEEWFLKGNTLSQKGQFDEAIAAYDKSIKLNPSATVVHINKGLAFKKKKNYEGARLSFEKAVELEPQNMEARFLLGNAYNFLERWEDAIAQLNIVVHRIQNDAEAHGNLGWAFFNYDKQPPFKLLTLINLEKAVELFEEQNLKEAAASTKDLLAEARRRFNYKR
ncbi:MAG: tetratricopeptide repeat protein [Candidatus Nitrohelix vancouverensis]|uniref:Tetratricopeptide repeat protein n=1 Tax=Candidatus Nitrohelix vancouverensis TaxID=2705534 RepID=A0A7T0C4J8_9BACT|nr:MAG: tetratricopeptide repeat protein [Candidatus Nitrohelix vancouverensis]